MTTPAKTQILWMPEAVDWYRSLTPEQVAAVDFSLGLLAQYGALLSMPHAKKVVDAKEAIIELRPSTKAFAMRLFYAFNPRREAVIIIGADKKGAAEERAWTAKLAAKAGKTWDAYLRANGWRK